MKPTHEQMNPASTEVLVAEELAAMLHCSVKTIEERARRGDLPGLKFGDGWVFPRDALFQRLNELALSEASRRGRSERPTPSGVLRPVESDKGKRRPPVLPKLT